MRELPQGSPGLRPGLANAAPQAVPRPPMPAAERRMLLPGELYFGSQFRQLTTLLGSCVGIALWHPQRRLGGMCHYILPHRQRPAGASLDGRFGEEAMELMMAALARTGTRPTEYQAHLYGGADTMPDHLGVKLNVGERNIEAGWQLIERYGLNLDTVDVGDRVPRSLCLDLDSGECRCRRGGGTPQEH
jgi:chemotaxis protein CheD